MKKILTLVVALGLLSFGAMALAHGGPSYGPGYGGYGGHMMGGGPGYGGGYGWGGDHMMGGGGRGYGRCDGPDGAQGNVDPEKRAAFFKETSDLRKQLHDKMFELKEAYFSGDEKKAEKISKEVEALREKLFEAAKKHGIVSDDASKGYGRGYGRGYGGHMGQGHMGQGWGGR